jgi:hypothetical protein
LALREGGVDISTESGCLGHADEATVRAAFACPDGFGDFAILSRGELEFLQSGHWYFVLRSTDNDVWTDAFEAAAAGMPESDDDSSGPDLYAVEFRDEHGLWGVRQVFTRDELLVLFLRYLRGGEGWRERLDWVPLQSEG